LKKLSLGKKAGIQTLECLRLNSSTRAHKELLELGLRTEILLYNYFVLVQ